MGDRPRERLYPIHFAGAAGLAIGIGLAFALAEVVGYALVFGGDVCPDTSQMVHSCGVPPAGMVVALPAGIFLALTLDHTLHHVR